jgi:transposase-like protein
MEGRLQRLYERVRRELGEVRTSGSRYPDELQREAVECLQEGLEQGLSIRQMAAKSGISSPTLRGWLRSCTGGLRAVEVMAEEPVVSSRAGERRDRVLVSPRGLRVEGLELEEIATLLRVLG